MNCKICGRILTDSISVKFNIGPTCRKKYPQLDNLHSEEEIDKWIFANLGRRNQ